MAAIRASRVEAGGGAVAEERAPRVDSPRLAVVPALRSYQLEAGRAIIDSALNGRGLTFTVVMARQAGKNELSVQLELFLLLRNAGRSLDGIKCAPTFDPQCRISLRRLSARMREAGLLSLSAKEDGRALRVGRARQVFLSAEPTAAVMGHTAGLLLEVDEAQDVDREKFERDFRPMAAPAGATIVFYGTPWDDSTLLEQAVQTNLELERRDGVRRHFAADWSTVAGFNPAYGRFVEAERARLGEEHPLFRTQYCLKTVAGGGRLFNGAQLAQLQGAHARRHAPEPQEVYVAGLDLGGQALDEVSRAGGASHDATVLTIARVVFPPAGALLPEPKLEVVEHVAFAGELHDSLFARLADLLGQVWRVRRVSVDATGLGETMARLLARSLGGEVVEPVRFTAESKSQMGYELLAAVNGGRLKVYAGDGSPEYMEFRREMELARVSYRPSRQMNFFVEPARGHDDYVMSLALAVQAARGAGLRPRVARGRAGAMS
jgi:hypothetical protein